MAFLYYVLAFLIVINLIVVVHEYGHYLAAKKIGVKVEKFSIGMGPEIFGFTDKEGTRWCVSWLLIGGYVMMLGDGDAASATEDLEAHAKLSEEEKKRSIISKSNWQKMFVAFAGPFANYVYAFVVIFLMALTYGVPKYEPIIGEVLKNSAAEKAGLLTGDKIVSVDGERTEKFRDVLVHLSLSDKDEATFAIERDGRLRSITIMPEITEKKRLMGSPQKRKVFGIKSGTPKFIRLSFSQSISRAFTDCITATKEMFFVFGKLFSGTKSLNDFGGVIQMTQVAGNMAQQGNFALLVLFTVTISLNLGFINLFPLPVLDGGRILICFLEEVFRRKFNEKIQEYIMMVCAIFLIFLMFLTTINDILRIDVIYNSVSNFLGGS